MQRRRCLFVAVNKIEVAVDQGEGRQVGKRAGDVWNETPGLQGYA